MKRSWFAGLTLALGMTAHSAHAQTNAAVLAPGQGGQAISGSAVPGGENGSGLPPGEKSQVSLVRVAPEPANSRSIYGNAEYLSWWLRKSNNPPLATSGNPLNTPTGALDQPGTSILFGGERSGPGAFSGARFTLGVWLGNDQTWAVEANYFFLGQREQNFSVSGTGGPGTSSLNIPFFNADGNFEDAFQIALPGIQLGSIAIRTSNRLEGAEFNLRTKFSETDCARVSLIGGFRYLALYESLDMASSADFLPLPVGVSTFFTDGFGTRNRFYGAQIGIDTEFASGNWRVNLQGKVALGSMNQRVNITGLTTNIDPINGTVTTPGGLFTAPSNLGEHDRSVFAVVPELGATLGYQLSRNWSATLGYTFIYASNVVRSGDQIDRGINFIPPAAGPTRPEPGFHTSSFWAQGVNFGLQFRY